METSLKTFPLHDLLFKKSCYRKSLSSSKMYLCDRSCGVRQEIVQWTAAHRAMESWSLQPASRKEWRELAVSAFPCAFSFCLSSYRNCVVSDPAGNQRFEACG